MNILSREFEILSLLISERNITKAANRAGLQQPAVSKILLQLENRLNRKLFSRIRTGLVPTDFALELNRIAVKTEGLWKESFNQLTEKDSRIEGVCTIGCHPLIAHFHLARNFAHLQNQYPELTLQLTLEPSLLISEKVAKGDLQFGVVANPVKYPDLVSFSLTPENVYLYANGEVKAGSCVYYNPEMIDVLRFTSRLKHFKLVPISDYQLIAKLLLQQKNQGAILVSSLGDSYSQFKRVSHSYYKTEIKLIYRRDLYRSPVIRVVLEQLKMNS